MILIIEGMPLTPSRLAKLTICAEKRGGQLVAWSKHHADLRCVSHGVFRQLIADTLYNGAWCPDCKREKLRSLFRTPYGECVRQVEARGYTVVTVQDEYVNAHSLVIACPNGHAAKGRYQHLIQDGKCCGTCNARRGEQMTRLVLERIFLVPFPSSRPPWLKRDAGGRLQLDGYAADLAIAFEYQGQQHYTADNQFHRGGLAAWNAQRTRDAEKRWLCAEHRVTLIEVPYFIGNMLYDGAQVIARVEHAIALAGVSIQQWDRAGFDPVRETTSVADLHELSEVGDTLAQNLLDTVWRGVDFLYEWQCRHCNENYRSSAYQKRLGRGCPHCGRRRAARTRAERNGNLQELETYATQRGGMCLAKKYRNATDHYTFRCGAGHEWPAMWSLMRRRHSWCISCATHASWHSPKATSRRPPRPNINVLQAAAVQRGGHCLSSVYVTAKTMYRWSCERDHDEWQATWDSIKQGHWCPLCAPAIISAKRLGKKAKADTITTIETLVAAAGRRGGRCLSSAYVGSKAKYLWVCEFGHSWQATWNNIGKRAGTWCPDPDCNRGRLATQRSVASLPKSKGATSAHS